MASPSVGREERGHHRTRVGREDQDLLPPLTSNPRLPWSTVWRPSSPESSCSLRENCRSSLCRAFPLAETTRGASPPLGTTPQGAGSSTTVPNPDSLNASTPPHSGAWRKAAIAFANTGRIRPSAVFNAGFERNKSFFHAEPAKSICPMSSRNRIRAHGGEMVVYVPRAMSHSRHIYFP
jgi:hypothetical protein